ncbi:MAG: dephospho-CoA kinase [Caldimonas sp.]
MDAAALRLRVGLTGGIGSGKSTVAARLVRHGADLIDTDAIARTLTLAGGSAIDAIRSAFGPVFIAADGSLDRARMREAAFADVGARQRLEAILHPLIGAEVERRAATSSSLVTILDIPLLVESGRWRSRVDRVWLVDCAEALQVERVMTRSGWTESAVRAVVAQQASRAERRAAADAVIDNDGIGIEELGLEVDTLWRQAIALA